MRQENTMRYRGYNSIMSDWNTPETETVGERKAYAFPVERRVVKYDTPFSLSAPAQFDRRVVLMRGDTGYPLAVVSNRYHPVTHMELVDHFDDALREAGIYFKRRFTMVNRGEQIRVEYRFPDIKVRVNNSDVEMTLTIVNSFDRTTGIMIRMGAFVLVCSNGMVVGRVIAWLKRTHRTKDLNLSDMSSRLSDLAERFKGYQTEWDAMMSKHLSRLAAEEYFGKLFDPKETPNTRFRVSKIYHTPILQQFTREPQTVWGMYNAITWVASHRARGIGPTLMLMDLANHVATELMKGNTLLSTLPEVPESHQLPPSSLAEDGFRE